MGFPTHFFTEKTPQRFNDNSTTTSHRPIPPFPRIWAVGERSLRCIQCQGFPTGSPSLNIQECLSRVSSSSSSSSLALFTLVLARMLLSSAGLYLLTERSSHPLWMGPSLQGWRNSITPFGLQWVKQGACHSITGSIASERMDRMEAWATIWVSNIFINNCIVVYLKC